MKRSVLLWALAAIAAILVALWFAFGRGGAPKDVAAAAPAVEVAAVKTGAFIERVTAQGRVGPPAGSSAKVAFSQPGIVASVNVHVGDRVAAGTALAELDRRPLAAALSQAQADASAASGAYGGGSLPAASLRNAQAKLAVAQARLQNLQVGGPGAQSDRIAAQSALRQAELKVDASRGALARTRVLFEGGVVAAKDVQAAQNQLGSDESDLRAAQAKVAAAGVGLDAAIASAKADYAGAQNDLKTAEAQQQILEAQRDAAAARSQAAAVSYEAGVLRAPADGVVIAILKHPGEAADPASAAIEIGPADAHSVTLNVPAATAQRIHVGDLAELSVARSGIRSTARVSAVVPIVDPLTQSATVTLAGAPQDAAPGDSVTATIVVNHLTGTIVPAEAVVEDPQTGKTLVFVQKKDGSFSAREVTLRASDTGRALIASGVRPGEHVASQGSYELLASPGG